MLSQNVVESDDFYKLSPQAQALYLHLCLSADDDGLVGSAQRVVRAMGIAKKSLDLLEQSGYVIVFGSGVVCITHWFLHNKIRRDRYTKTRYQKERGELIINDSEEYQRYRGGFVGYLSDIATAQDRLDKVKTDKDRKEENSIKEITEDREDTSAAYSIKKDRFIKESSALSEYERRLDEEQLESYRSFLRKVNLYARTYYPVENADGFIKQNEERGWVDGPVNVRANYRDCLDAYMADFEIEPRLIFRGSPLPR